MTAESTIEAAVRRLARLPGVGEKSATRLVYWILRQPPEFAQGLANALQELVLNVRECEQCCDVTTEVHCAICSDPERTEHQIVVVERPTDIRAFERAGEYKGHYHVLHGALSPLDGVGPSDLRIRELLDRLRDPAVAEVVLALDPDAEGDTTALYLARLMERVDVKVTRLAHGVSVGTQIEYADAVSLARAFQNRTEIA